MERQVALLQQLSLENQKAQDHVINLMESFRAMSSTLEIDEVLKKIMHFALKIVETAEAGYIQMYDENSNKLIVKTYEGFNENIQNFEVSVGQSITGKVFKEGRLKLITKREEIYEQMGDLSQENFHLIDQAHPNNKNIKSLLSVPVSFGTKRMGVMTFHCFDVEDRLNETDFLLLESFAAQASIALHNAQLHSEVQKSLDEVIHLSQELKETNAILGKQTEIHKHLTELSVQNNNGLKGIIKEMDRLMERKLVYADYLEGRCIPEHIKYFDKILDDIFLIFANKTEPSYVSIHDNVQLDFHIYPIRSGSVFLGCLIVEGRSFLSQLDKLIIEQGAPILSLEIMKLRSQTEIMYKKTYETYQQFLKIKNPQQADIAAKELGIHNHYFLQTAIIELDGNGDLRSLENDAMLLLTHLKENLTIKNSLLFSYHNKIFYFSSTKDATIEESIIKTLERSINWWNEGFSARARAGFSTGYCFPGQAEENHLKAEKALLHLKKQMKNGFLHYKDIGISSLFLNHPLEEINSFLQETFSGLWLNQEKESELGELLQTLFKYVENNRAMAATAKDLHIHTNTLYHRIKKIEELLAMDFSHYEDYLKVQLAVYLYKTFLVD